MRRRPVSATVVPLAGGYWSPGPEREPFRRIAEALGAQAHGLMVPGLVDDATTKHALEAHAGVRAVLDLWSRLDVALVGIGGRAWGAASVGDDVAGELERAGAVGEILIAPFDLDGVFVCPALRERVLAFDARALGRVPVAIGVGAGESKVRPVLGALRAGAIRTLVTDVATAEAVVALDAETLGLMSANATRRRSSASTSGTTEVKAGLVDLDGRLLAIARAGYGLEVGHGPGWAEQDPGAWWSAVVGAVRGLHPTEPVEIVAIGVDGHGPTLAAVDGRGEATRPAITFLDTRATAEAEELAAATGIHGWALGPLPAALWLERHEPEVAERDPLVPHDLGVARVPADRRGRRATGPAPGRTGCSASSRRPPVCTWNGVRRRARWAARSGS